MLELSGICKSYHRQNILDGVELTVRPGECVGIVGYNGCGKTTLLSIIAGALKADKGSILFNGRQAVGHPRVFAEEAAYVPQENPLMEELKGQPAAVVQGKQDRDGRRPKERRSRHAGRG